MHSILLLTPSLPCNQVSVGIKLIPWQIILSFLSSLGERIFCEVWPEPTVIWRAFHF